MVKRIQCRVVHSVGLTSRSGCADPAEPSAPDPNIERILNSIYNIQSKIYNRNADPTCPEPVDPDIEKILSLIYNIKCSWLRKKLSNRNARPGLIIDFVA